MHKHKTETKRCYYGEESRVEKEVEENGSLQSKLIGHICTADLEKF